MYIIEKYCVILFSTERVNGTKFLEYILSYNILKFGRNSTKDKNSTAQNVRKMRTKCNKKVKKRNFNFKSFFDDVISFGTDNQYMNLYLQLPLCSGIQKYNGVPVLVFALF